MTLFNRSPKGNSSRGSTRGFYIGSTEAEAENKKGKLNHGHYFEDYLEILPQIEQGRFIISGRKGSGKSAIAKFIKDKADEMKDAYADLIRLSDLELEKLKQFDERNEFENKERILVEWVILVRLIGLIVQNEDAQYISEFKPLKKFLDRNAGIVKIDQFEVTEIILNKKYEVSFEVLSRAFRPVFGKYFDIKTVKAPFYKLINPLKEIIQKILNYEVNNSKDFILLFDDLDINLKAYDEKNINAITELIRISKNYNNEIFRNTQARIIVLIRDDIKKLIDSFHSDTAKIFTSYEIVLNWYDHESFKFNENYTQLKKFINKRIRLNFEEKNLTFDQSDPWSTLVANEDPYYFDKTAFKFILDHSFYRPRDLILFFNPIGQNDFKYPLRSNEIKFLLKTYAEENMREIKNELSLLMTSVEINQLMNVLKEISVPQTITNQHIENAIHKYKLSISADVVVKLFCSYSLLGLKDKKCQKIYFSHRENFDLESMILSDFDFIIHKVPYLYFNPSVQSFFG